MKPLALLALASLAACATNDTPLTTRPAAITPADQAAVQFAVVERLKDPSTAQLRRLQAFDLSNGDRAICGEVNGRNSFGGYVGFEPFYVRTRSNQIVTFHLASPQYEWTGREIRQSCADAAAGQMMVDGNL